MRRFLFAVFLVVACATGAAAGSFDEADSSVAQFIRSRAEQGDAVAQFDLGRLYDKGQGVTQDVQEAVKWYRLAAAQDYAKAQYNLGVMYIQGKGVPQDFVRAHMWLNIAAAALSGEDGTEAMERQDSVASQMTAAQIEKAQEMARRCKQSKYKECD